MSQSNTHLIRKRGSNVLYPYSDDLAAKPGFVTLTMQEALDQGLLDKRRHTKGPDPQTSELVGVIETLKAENAALQDKLNAHMSNGVDAAPEPEQDSPIPHVVDKIRADAQEDEAATNVVDEANELSELLAEIDNGSADAE